MKKILIFVLLLSCQLNTKVENLNFHFSAYVNEVIDGDTIVVISLENLSNFSIFSNHSYVVRLLNIDAPETKENERFERFLDKLYQKEIYLKRNEILNLGKLSLSNLSSVLYKNDMVIVNFNSFNYLDIYERILAIVYKGETNINLYQLETGYAFCYFYNQRKNEDFIKAENVAKKKKKGLWKILN
ncbi:MAG: thermonuclease family protein [Brevinematales bacterium]|nr:thermonuclease family protein [Brevinematales bacterium]